MEKDISFENLPKAVNQLHEKLQNIERMLSEKSNPESIKTQEQFLTVKEAASFLKLKVPTIYSKVSSGELSHMKRGNRLYFLTTELMEYLKAGRKKTNGEIQAEVDSYLEKKGGLND